MNKETIIERLENLNNIGKEISGKVKGTQIKESNGKIIDEVSHLVDENKYVIQKIKIGNTISYRIGYYTCDANYTKLYYGESSPIMKRSDFEKLIDKGKEKGWI